jgi:hypothetical protein
MWFILFNPGRPPPVSHPRRDLYYLGLVLPIVSIPNIKTQSFHDPLLSHPYELDQYI